MKAWKHLKTITRHKIQVMKGCFMEEMDFKGFELININFTGAYMHKVNFNNADRVEKIKGLEVAEQEQAIENIIEDNIAVLENETEYSIEELKLSKVHIFVKIFYFFINNIALYYDFKNNLFSSFSNFKSYNNCNYCACCI